MARRLAAAAAVYVPAAVGGWPLCTAPVASAHCHFTRGDSAEQKEFQAKDELGSDSKEKEGSGFASNKTQISLDWT